MMTSLFKKMTVALALVGALGAASATPVLTNLGVMNNTLTYTRMNIGGVFDDAVFFKANTLLGALGGLWGFDYSGDLSGTYSFGVGDTFSTVNWLLSGNLPTANSQDIFSMTQQFPTLVSGQTYWFEVAGNMSDGEYHLTVAPSAIPEPGSLALVLAGVAAWGTTARRRKIASQEKVGA